MQAVSYATLRGMERYVDLHGPTAKFTPTGQDPAHALVCLTRLGDLPRLRSASTTLRSCKVLGAFAHDASDYFASDRQDMLELVPEHAMSILDVGGGQGHFLQLARASRKIRTHLCEANLDVAHAARKAGTADAVTASDFLTAQFAERFDCVSFMDMLEHVDQPVHYLRHAPVAKRCGVGVHSQRRTLVGGGGPSGRPLGPCPSGHPLRDTFAVLHLENGPGSVRQGRFTGGCRASGRCASIRALVERLARQPWPQR
jgi:hypothetical protein